MNIGEKDTQAGANSRPPHFLHGQRRPRKLRITRLLLAIIPAGVMLFCLSTYLHRGSNCSTKSSAGESKPHAEHQLLSNGTHWFRPTLVLVSVDGFRADYLDRGVTPELLRLGQKGLRADYMIPSFPSLTFPNHYTIVTGLYPGSHGIVSNEFFDTQTNDTFFYKDPLKSIDSKWWGGEPIWVTAEKQGLRAGINMWPGSMATICGHKPSYVVPFSDNVEPRLKTQKVLEWLDLPFDKRPAFLATYMPEVDSTAHKLGPNDQKVNEAVRLVDSALGNLWSEIARRNLTNIVNLMVVSDHGMAEGQSGLNAIYIDDYIDTSQLQGIYGWPLGGLQVKDSADVGAMYATLKRASAGQPWDVYLRDDIPSRFHYTYKSRIAPIYVISRVPYYVTTRKESALYSLGKPMGVHGYDNMHPLMRATFVAVGPAFRSRTAQAPPTPRLFVEPHVNLTALGMPGSQISDITAMQDYLELLRSAVVSRPGAVATGHHVYDYLWGDGRRNEAELRNIRHPPFENVELYGLMAKILGVVPAPNNGTADFARWWLH